MWHNFYFLSPLKHPQACNAWWRHLREKRLLNHGQIKNQFNRWPQTELRVCHGHKDSLSGHKKSNESVCRRYRLPHRDANSVALWKLMFYIYCSHPVEANEIKRLQNVTFSPNGTFSPPPLQPNFGDLGALPGSCLTSTVLPGCHEAQLPQKFRRVSVHTELLGPVYLHKIRGLALSCPRK